MKQLIAKSTLKSGEKYDYFAENKNGNWRLLLYLNGEPDTERNGIYTEFDSIVDLFAQVYADLDDMEEGDSEIPGQYTWFAEYDGAGHIVPCEY